VILIHGNVRAQSADSGERFFDLGADFKSKGVETLGQVANVLQELVVKNDSRDSDKEAGGSGDQRFGDAGSDGAEACGAGVAEARKGVNDAPDRSKKTDEGSGGAGSCEPGHAFFDAANFFGGSKLHAYGDGLKALEFSGGLRIAGTDLAEKFAIASSVNRRKRRTGRGQCLRIGDTFGGPEDADELVALATNAAEHTEFLENHGPGDNRENGEKEQNAAGNPAGLSKDIAEISDKKR